MIDWGHKLGGLVGLCRTGNAVASWVFSLYSGTVSFHELLLYSLLIDCMALSIILICCVLDLLNFLGGF